MVHHIGRSLCASLIFVGLANVTKAQDAPPVIRLVCYEVATQGDKDSQLPGFVAVAQQLDGSEFDATLFVPGTLKYDEALYREDIPMSLKVYKKARVEFSPGSTAEEIDALLLQPPDLGPLDVMGAKILETMGVTWQIGPDLNHMIYENSDQVYNTYINNADDGDARHIYCDVPYLVTPKN